MVEKTRTDLLNFLAEKYNLQQYLEIGVQNPAQNFNNIICAYKIGVDPVLSHCPGFYPITSDEFFAGLAIDTDKFDLIFIDGLHTAEQVKKDFENALKILSPNGFIVLHDCNPEKEEHTIVPRPTERGHWNGDVYKFAIMLSANHYYNTVDIDNGCGVFSGTIPPLYKGQMGAFTWNEFNQNREKLLNLISWDEFVASHTHV